MLSKIKHVRSKITSNKTHWHLNLHKRWFDMIYKGVKKHEYRELNEYWGKRFANAFDTIPPSGEYKPVPETIIFSNGYRKDRMQFEIQWISTRVDTGREDWGAEKGKEYYVICLGRVLQSNF